MKLTRLILASFLLMSLSSAAENKNPTKLKTSKSKKADKKQPKWMTQDKFDLTTLDDEGINMLSTKKGFLFDNGINKITLLVVWDRQCKSCAAWLLDMQSLQKSFPKKLNVITLEISNSQKKKLEKLSKSGKIDAKSANAIIDANKKDINKFTKKHDIYLPVVPIISGGDDNLAFATQALYKFEFSKPRGKAKRGGGLPFTIAFGYKGETAGITSGIVEKDTYKTYIEKLIKYYDNKSKETK